MIKNIALIQLILLLGLSFAYGSKTKYPYKPSTHYLELMNRTSYETRSFNHCVSESGLTDCDKGLCLVVTRLNRKKEHLELLSKFQVLCKENAVIRDLERIKGLWYEIDFNDKSWDDEGPSIISIENKKYGLNASLLRRSQVTKKEVEKFETYFKALASIWHDKNISIKGYKVKKDFYKFLQDNPYEKRTYETCVKQPSLDECEKRICLIMSKLNRSFSYYNEPRKYACNYQEITEATVMKRNQWLYDNGSHPNDWDSEGMPDHVLKMKKEFYDKAQKTNP